jgi:uncharacterized membrane protein YfcA
MFSQSEFLILAIYSVVFIISGVTGFGGMLLFLGITSFLSFDIKSLLFIAFVGTLAKSIYSAYLFRENIQWKEIRKILLFAFPFVAIGGMLTTQVPSDFIGKIIGGFILVYLSWKFFGKSRENFKLPVWGFRLWSICWGFFSGLIGAGGPIIVSLLNTLKLNKKEFVGTLQVLFTGAILIKLPLYYQIESPYSNNLKLIFAIILISFLASFLGKKINNYLPEKLFQQIVMGLLFITGMKMLLF